jgi:hypothetical protein
MAHQLLFRKVDDLYHSANKLFGALLFAVTLRRLLHDADMRLGTIFFLLDAFSFHLRARCVQLLFVCSLRSASICLLLR